MGRIGGKNVENKSQSKLEKWRAKYASLTTAFSCLYLLIATWGEGWIFTTIMILGVLICGAFAISDLKRVH